MGGGVALRAGVACTSSAGAAVAQSDGEMGAGDGWRCRLLRGMDGSVLGDDPQVETWGLTGCWKGFVVFFGVGDGCWYG